MNIYRGIKDREIYWLVLDYVPNLSNEGQLMTVYRDEKDEVFIMDRTCFHGAFEKLKSTRFGKKYVKFNTVIRK